MSSERTSFRASLPAQISSRGMLLVVFLLAVLAMLPFQIFRLYQAEALPWLLADYSGRLFTLGLLFVHPGGRAMLLRPERLQLPAMEALFWILGILALFSAYGPLAWLGDIMPETQLGRYPRPSGWLYLFDLTFGLALVALHEEIVYRRVAAAALSRFCRSDLWLAIVSAAIFAAYHWWTGIGNVIFCFIFGAVAMACYRRMGSLWPVGIAHYTLDVIAFA